MDPTLISALQESGAIIVIAANKDAVRTWLPGALLGRVELPHVIVRVGHLEVDLTEHRSKWRGRRVEMSHHELKLLAALGSEPGRAWTFGELTERVWGTTYENRNALVCAVRRLRKRLIRAGADVRIESVWGVGFRIVTVSDLSERPKGQPPISSRAEVPSAGVPVVAD
jgi:DNA-binding winged helix-turn-helix (wHTH) protein